MLKMRMKARVVVMTKMYDNEKKGKGKNIDSNYNTDTDITILVNTIGTNDENAKTMKKGGPVHQCRKEQQQR